MFYFFIVALLHILGYIQSAFSALSKRSRMYINDAVSMSYFSCATTPSVLLSSLLQATNRGRKRKRQESMPPQRSSQATGHHFLINMKEQINGGISPETRRLQWMTESASQH